MCFYIRQLKKVCEKTTSPIDNDLSELHDAEVHVLSESRELNERRRQSNVPKYETMNLCSTLMMAQEFVEHQFVLFSKGKQQMRSGNTSTFRLHQVRM